MWILYNVQEGSVFIFKDKYGITSIKLPINQFVY